ncbi:MAG TPA: rhomboid family intramembrane serine protease [Candidatus Baltobacteraceae bacterium]|nr:rhomboid family intramembrane serine protease [Candidatus Baltobacteraceae bacterium]
MIIPLAHENLRGRRLPWVTIAIIAVNFVVFLATYGVMQREAQASGEAQLHIILVSARYPDTHMTPDATEVVDAFKRQHAQVFEQLAQPHRRPVDSWDAQFLMAQFAPDGADYVMSHLCDDLEKSRQGSILWNYAFHPFHPFLKTYITASFLHGGWLHIIFNMWFLWLVGVALEDTWGRVVYPIFYLVCGALGFAIHAMVFPGSLVPVVGASAAIAGLMGGFLARFPKSNIRLAWILFIKPVKFSVPAYIILPAWLLIEVFWGAIFAATNSEGGVAHWAHVGGFVFGALGALLLKHTGVEQSLDHAIESKVSWTADDRMVRATDSLEENNPAGAIASLRQLVTEKPDSIEGWEMLLAAQQRRPDPQGQKESLEVLCRLHTAAGEMESAWNDYLEFRSLGGEKIPRGVWLELCRYLESKHDWEGAATEYERLAEQNSRERAGASALVAAARIRLTNLNEPDRAAKLYQAAAASTAPHSDLDAEIQEGLRQCAKALPVHQSDTYSG